MRTGVMTGGAALVSLCLGLGVSVTAGPDAVQESKAAGNLPEGKAAGAR